MARLMPALEFRSFHSPRSCENVPNTTRLATLGMLFACWVSKTKNSIFPLSERPKPDRTPIDNDMEDIP
jgi:hypothetical protein